MFFFIILRNLTSTFYIKPTCTEIKSVCKKKKKNGQLNSLKCRLAFFGQSNNFVWPIFAVLGPLPLTDRAKMLEGVVNSPAFLVLWNLNRLVLKP